jgi:hypothetical protein
MSELLQAASTKNKTSHMIKTLRETKGNNLNNQKYIKTPKLSILLHMQSFRIGKFDLNFMK